MSAPLLEVRDLAVPRSRLLRRGHRPGVSLRIGRGESFGLVGETGSGASELARAVVAAGPGVLVDGLDAASYGPGVLRRRIRALRPTPRRDGRRDVAAVLDAERRARGLPAAGAAELRALADAVGLPAAALRRPPHELTPVQRRRVDLAAALCTDPDLIVADEPTAGLDVTVAAQLLDLLGRVRAERGTAYLVVAGDPVLAAYLSDRVGVMYLGGIVEQAPARALLRDPRHPYTRALLSAVPVPDPEVEDRRERILLPGTAPSAPPAGCAFHPRCPWVRAERCADEPPRLREPAGADAGRQVACHHAEGIGAGRAHRPDVTSVSESDRSGSRVADDPVGCSDRPAG